MIKTDAELAELHWRPTTPRRFMAYVLDGILLAVVGFVYWEVLARAGVPPQAQVAPSWWSPELSGSPVQPTLNVTETTLLQLVQVAYAAAYFVGCWCLFGRTLGMGLLGLRVERAEDGRRLGILQGIARWLAIDGALGILSTFTQWDQGLSMVVLLAGLLWWMGLLLSTVSDLERRGWHDKLAGSLVVATR
jgi:uncharacterized RDD family membrane protein YckC